MTALLFAGHLQTPGQGSHSNQPNTYVSHPLTYWLFS